MNDLASHLTVRRIPPALATALAKERKRRKASLNSTVIGLLNHALGVDEFDRAARVRISLWIQKRQ